jgi:hypothetical protein
MDTREIAFASRLATTLMGVRRSNVGASLLAKGPKAPPKMEQVFRS